MALPNPLSVLALQVIEGTSSATDLLRQLETIPLAGLTKFIINTMGVGDADFGSFLFALGVLVQNLFDPVSVRDGATGATAEAKNLIAQGIRTTASIAMPKKVDKDAKASQAAATGNTAGSAVWQKIDGLADDQVFIVQRFRLTYESDVGVAGWLFVFPGRPFGSHLGQDVTDIDLVNVIQLSPGVPFQFGNTDNTVFQNLGVMTGLAPSAIFRLEGTNVNPVQELDLKPNYVSLRSYWTVYLGDNNASASPFFIMQLFGQKMPYALPSDLFN